MTQVMGWIRSLVFVLVVSRGLVAFALEVNILEVDLAVAPSQAYTFSFIARNETDVPEAFTVYVGDWDRDEAGGHRFYHPGTLSRSLSPWLTVGPGSFTLGAGEMREISGTIRVPSGAETGTYWGIVFVHGEPRPVQRQGTTVMVAKRIGIKVYATVGTAPSQGAVRKIEFRGLNPFWLIVDFVNPGLVNLREVRVEVMVYDIRGDQLARIEPPPVPCLPGATRWIAVETEFRPGPGVYLVLTKLDIGGDTLLGSSAYLRVAPLTLQPLRMTGSAPQDLDGDGFYEDLDGNGLFDAEDVQLFMEDFHKPLIQGNRRAFDFDNDGAVDWNDVFRLAEMLNATSP